MMDTIMGAVSGEPERKAGGEAGGEAGGPDTTVLFVEHDMDIVTRYAERVVAFYSGRVLADGPPATVLADENVRRYVTGSAR